MPSYVPKEERDHLIPPGIRLSHCVHYCARSNVRCVSIDTQLLLVEESSGRFDTGRMARRFAASDTGESGNYFYHVFYWLSIEPTRSFVQ